MTEFSFPIDYDNRDSLSSSLKSSSSSSSSLSSVEDCSDDESCINKYIFYIYHTANFDNDDDNCVVCDELAYDDNTSDVDRWGFHNDYDETVDDAMKNTVCYSRQKFIANLKKSTYERLSSESCDMNTVLFGLANMASWGSIDEEAGLDDLSEDEIIEDASDDMYVCYINDDGVEIDMIKYFKKHNIHLNIIGSGLSSHGEWHEPTLHINN